MNKNLSDQRREDINNYLEAGSKLRKVKDLLGQIKALIHDSSDRARDKELLEKGVEDSEESIAKLQKQIKFPK